MTPVIAIIGRPNVGKSTLFNSLTKRRDALVYSSLGVTRDRNYAEAYYNKYNYILIDTGGISCEKTHFNKSITKQSILAIEESDLVYFVVDARAGKTTEDDEISSFLRSRKKLNIFLVVNKTDGLREELVVSEFYEYGFRNIYPISAAHRRGLNTLLKETLLPLFISDNTSKAKDCSIKNDEHSIRFALIGRPNTGKSTLTNRILGEDRVVVYDMPGTTTDSVSIPLSHNGKDYTIIDTAGVRRRGKIKEVLEKFSIIKTLKTIEKSSVIMILIDAGEGFTHQDLHLIDYVLNLGKSLVICINKWDTINDSDKKRFKEQMNSRIVPLKDYIDIHFISALSLHDGNVKHLLKSIENAFHSANKSISTSQLTKALHLAIENHLTPMAGKFRIKLKFAHMGDSNPPTIIIHGNQVTKLPDSYKRYLEKFFRESFKLVGTPIKIIFKQSVNPYRNNS
jgi:GTP-binding protein